MRIYPSQERALGHSFCIKADKDHLISTKVIIHMGCLPILRMISWCVVSNLDMLRWNTYIKSMNPTIHHIARKKQHHGRRVITGLGVKMKTTWCQMMKMFLVSSLRWPKHFLKNEVCKCSTPSMKSRMKRSGYTYIGS